MRVDNRTDPPQAASGQSRVDISDSERNACRCRKGAIDPDCKRHGTRRSCWRYERTLIKLGPGADVVAIDHRGELTERARSTLKRIGRKVVKLAVDEQLLARQVQIGPLGELEPPRR
jgi:hypothetical protein